MLIGNETIKTQIKIAIQSATQRNMAVGHMLFDGAAGCGKTSMAKEVSKLCKGDFISSVPVNLSSKKEVLNLLDKLNVIGYDQKGDRIGKIKPTVIFFDEIHNMPLKGQEILGIAMENFIVDSEKPNSCYWVPYFTVVGATTMSGILSRPFLNRFKMHFMFSPYSIDESEQIIKIHSNRLKISMTEDAVKDVALRGRGVPRIMVGYLETIRDYGLSRGTYKIDSNIVDRVFQDMGIDKKGFTRVEIKILKTLYEIGDAVGLESLSIITNESHRSLKERIEPFLIQKGLMIRQSKGRKITDKGIRYLEEANHIEGTSRRRAEIPVTYVRK